MRCSPCNPVWEGLFELITILVAAIHTRSSLVALRVTGRKRAFYPLLSLPSPPMTNQPTIRPGNSADGSEGLLHVIFTMHAALSVPDILESILDHIVWTAWQNDMISLSLVGNQFFLPPMRRIWKYVDVRMMTRLLPQTTQGSNSKSLELVHQSVYVALNRAQAYSSLISGPHNRQQRPWQPRTLELVRGYTHHLFAV